MLLRTTVLLKRSALVLLALALVLLTLRVVLTERGPDLEPWHKLVPDELSASQLDSSDWPRYLAQEQAIFAEVNAVVSEGLPDDSPEIYNRYAKNSPVYPGHFAHDWNRSYQLLPAGKPRGAVVMLHGLTDSPYSLRHVAETYQRAGWAVVAIRLPGHGTVPGALTRVDWEAWLAATRLAVREARRLTGDSAPLQLVGFSNGGALAMKYTLDALDDRSLPLPDRVIMLSPMIGVSSYARYAGLAGLPSLLPAFARSAWLSILPEFNPFKYNSFPVKAARQSWLLTSALQSQLHRQAASGQLASLPPLLTFQSVADATVSTPAVVRGLYDLLPDNGSELVLFDVNRSLRLAPLMRSSSLHASQHLLPPVPRNYTTTLVTTTSPENNATVAHITPAGSRDDIIESLNVSWPAQMYSLSHVALPFPPADSLYGSAPDHPGEFGISFGTLSPRGERSVLIVSLDMLMRQSSNPFYDWMMQRVERTLER